jgi:basic amino acid/polyamine antiporter, APA family
VSAWTQDRAHRRFPRPLQVLGAFGCLVLAATLPLESVVAGAGVFVIGALGRWARQALVTGRRPRPSR